MHVNPNIRGSATITNATNMVNNLVTRNEHLVVNNGTNTLKLRPHSTPATLCWLEKNYELSEGVCIPRNVVYYNYTDFCRKNGMQPVNAASFGKVPTDRLINLNMALHNTSK